MIEFISYLGQISEPPVAIRDDPGPPEQSVSAFFQFCDGYKRDVNVIRVDNMKPTGQIEQLTIALFDGNTASSPGYNDYLNGYVYIFYGWGNTKRRLTRGAGSSNVWLCDMITATPALLNNYYELEARWLDADKTDGDNLFGLVDGEIPAGLEARDGEYTSGTYLGFASWSNAEWRIDRVYVRKCASVEPAVEISGTFERPSNPASMPTPLTTSFEYDDYNKLTEITYPDSTTETLSYDDNGQLVRREKSTGEVTGYEWNDQGMLVKVILPNGEPVEYEYDGNQRLISRKSSDGVDNFVQSGWDIMTKMDDVGKRTYYTGSSAVESEDSVKYFHYNHRGDTVLLTNANGEILHNLNYEAYGRPTNNEGIPINTLSLSNITAPNSSSNITGGSGNNLPNLFVGASGIRYDTKTNLHYMRFRWFSGEQMRFISADLLMDLNRYAYVSGNPVNYFDPMGLWKYGIKDNGHVIIIPEKGDNPSKIKNIPKYQKATFNGDDGVEAGFDISGSLGEFTTDLFMRQYKMGKNSRGYQCLGFFAAFYQIWNWKERFDKSPKGQLINADSTNYHAYPYYSEVVQRLFRDSKKISDEIKIQPFSYKVDALAEEGEVIERAKSVDEMVFGDFMINYYVNYDRGLSDRHFMVYMGIDQEFLSKGSWTSKLHIKHEDIHPFGTKNPYKLKPGKPGKEPNEYSRLYHIKDKKKFVERMTRWYKMQCKNGKK